MAGPAFKTVVTGQEALEAGLKAKLKETVKAIAAATYMEGEETITEGKKQTPVDEGPLRASGHVQLPKVSARTIEVELGFGGPAGAGNQGGDSNDEDVGYAVYVHEDMTANHTVGKAKFLEDPVKERQAGMPARIVRRANRRIGK